jgi:O-methyltransferase involved in polyketide biosynthesis
VVDGRIKADEPRIVNGAELETREKKISPKSTHLTTALVCVTSDEANPLFPDEFARAATSKNTAMPDLKSPVQRCSPRSPSFSTANRNTSASRY